MEETLKEVLMERDDLTPEEADEIISEMRVMVEDGEDPEEVLSYTVGLEPDYIFDLLV